MTIDIIIISCLVIVIILLLITIRKTNIKSDNNFDIDIKQINKNLENLYNKALEIVKSERKAEHICWI